MDSVDRGTTTTVAVEAKAARITTVDLSRDIAGTITAATTEDSRVGSNRAASRIGTRTRTGDRVASREENSRCSKAEAPTSNNSRDLKDAPNRDAHNNTHDLLSMDPPRNSNNKEQLPSSSCSSPSQVAMHLRPSSRRSMSSRH